MGWRSAGACSCIPEVPIVRNQGRTIQANIGTKSQLRKLATIVRAEAIDIRTRIDGDVFGGLYRVAGTGIGYHPQHVYATGKSGSIDRLGCLGACSLKGRVLVPAIIDIGRW